MKNNIVFPPMKCPGVDWCLWCLVSRVGRVARPETHSTIDLTAAALPGPSAALITANTGPHSVSHQARFDQFKMILTGCVGCYSRYLSSHLSFLFAKREKTGEEQEGGSKSHISISHTGLECRLAALLVSMITCNSGPRQATQVSILRPSTERNIVPWSSCLLSPHYEFSCPLIIRSPVPAPQYQDASHVSPLTWLDPSLPSQAGCRLMYSEMIDSVPVWLHHYTFPEMLNSPNTPPPN